MRKDLWCGWTAERLTAFLKFCVSVYDFSPGTLRSYHCKELAYFLQQPDTKALAYSIVPNRIVVALTLDGYINFNTGE
jgi:hypothetical protein